MDGSEIYNLVELNAEATNIWKFGTPLSKPVVGGRGITAMSDFYITGMNIFKNLSSHFIPHIYK